MTRHWSDIWWRVSLYAMFQTFNNQTDIPDDLKPHYSKREDGKWHADIPDEHPAIKNNAKLLTDKTTAESKVTKLESDLASAQAGNLGRGQVAVTTADAKLLDQYKALGTPDEVGTKLSQGKMDSEELATRKRSDSLRQLAKDLGYTNVEAFVRLPNLPEFTSRAGKDGKTEWFAQMKDDKGVVSEKPAKEWIESSPDIQPFMPALKQSDGVRVPTTGPTTSVSVADPHAWAKEYAKNYVEQSQPVADPFKAFSERNSAA